MMLSMWRGSVAGGGHGCQGPPGRHGAGPPGAGALDMDGQGSHCRHPSSTPDRQGP